MLNHVPSDRWRSIHSGLKCTIYPICFIFYNENISKHLSTLIEYLIFVFAKNENNAALFIPIKIIPMSTISKMQCIWIQIVDRRNSDDDDNRYGIRKSIHFWMLQIFDIIKIQININKKMSQHLYPLIPYPYALQRFVFKFVLPISSSF